MSPEDLPLLLFLFKKIAILRSVLELTIAFNHNNKACFVNRSISLNHSSPIKSHIKIGTDRDSQRRKTKRSIVATSSAKLKIMWLQVYQFSGWKHILISFRSKCFLESLLPIRTTIDIRSLSTFVEIIDRIANFLVLSRCGIISLNKRLDPTEIILKVNPWNTSPVPDWIIG